jgi:class 3 adenylate cyclase
VNTGGGAAVWTEREPRTDGVRLVPKGQSPAVYEVVARPVVFEETVHGVVIAGTRVDQKTLAGLRSISGLDIALVAHGAVVASTLPQPAHDRLAREWRAQGERPPRTLGAAYRMRSSPLVPEREPLAQYVLLASLDEERAFVHRVRLSLLLAGAGILALALAVAFPLARGITTPVRELALAARRVGAGDLDAEVRVASRDELGELATAWNEMTSGLRERDRLRRTFERYVSKDVAAEILRHPELAPVAGEARELTVAFVDIGGFTQLAERLAPAALVRRLNEYFEVVCAAVLARNGTVNEFVGDGVVVYWGAPMPQPDHALRASLAALDARERLAALAARWRVDGIPGAHFRIGIHTGALVIGEIGSDERRAYRAVGDAMNLASRIEGANKVYGTQLLVSEATRASAGEALLAREVDLVRVVGRAQPVRLFELVAPAETATVDQRGFVARWEAALARYRAREFAAAAAAFSACAPDPAATVLGARAAAFAAAPPAPDWDGVHALDEK